MNFTYFCLCRNRVLYYCLSVIFVRPFCLAVLHLNHACDLGGEYVYIGVVSFNSICKMLISDGDIIAWSNGLVDIECTYIKLFVFTTLFKTIT
jgi:hypothetical protein